MPTPVRPATRAASRAPSPPGLGAAAARAAAPRTTAPARLLTPTAATPALASTPDFCRNLAFSAMPPTLAGETRLTNDDAPWASTVGQNRMRCGTAPIRATALARYVTADKTMTSGSQAQSAD